MEFKIRKIIHLQAGADLGFSRRGGGGFSKILTTFFKVDQIDFASSPKAVKSIKYKLIDFFSSNKSIMAISFPLTRFERFLSWIKTGLTR